MADVREVLGMEGERSRAVLDRLPAVADSTGFAGSRAGDL